MKHMSLPWANPVSHFVKLYQADEHCPFLLHWNKYIPIYLFQFSTCFEHPCAHHQENQLYEYDIWYMSTT